MSGPADLVVWNQGNSALSVQGHSIAAGGSYTVSYSDIVTWSKDPYLQVYVFSGQLYLVALGIKYLGQDALNFLEKIALTTVVYAS